MTNGQHKEYVAPRLGPLEKAILSAYEIGEPKISLDIAKDTTNKTYDTISRFGKIITSIEQKMNAQKINRKRKCNLSCNNG